MNMTYSNAIATKLYQEFQSNRNHELLGLRHRQLSPCPNVTVNPLICSKS